MVTNAALNESVTLNLVGNYTGASWFLSLDSTTGGTKVVDPADQTRPAPPETPGEPS
jgi:hypothetical protein